MEKKKTNNPNGRPKGTPNKVTTELRVRISEFLEKNFETIETDFEKLEPRERAQLYIKLIEYVIPKMRTFEETTLSQLYQMTPEQREKRIKELEKTLSE